MPAATGCHNSDGHNPPLKVNRHKFWQHMATIFYRKKPETPLKGTFIVAFSITAAIELLWQCKVGRWNCRNSPSHNRPNETLAAFFGLLRRFWPTAIAQFFCSERERISLKCKESSLTHKKILKRMIFRMFKSSEDQKF